MQELSVMIIDDEPIARSIIENYVGQLGNWKVLASCNNGIEALNVLNSGQAPDVIFLDINMPVINGIEFFRALKNPPSVVLTTAYAEFAVEAFELNAVDYLIKPISFERFLITAQRINELHTTEKEANMPTQATRDFVFLKHNGKMLKVNFAEIIYIEAKGDYINICMGAKSLLINMNLKDIEECIPAETFIRVHRSFIVNVRKITAVFGNTVEIEKKQIPIGLNYKEAFLKHLTDGE